MSAQPYSLWHSCQEAGDLLKRGWAMSQILQLGGEFGGDYSVK